jgi:hypothetical protein
MLILSTVVKAMREMGITEPHKNFAVVKQAINVNVLIKKKPFTIDEINTIKSFVQKINSIFGKTKFPVSETIGYAPINEAEIMYLPAIYQNSKNSFVEFMESVRLFKEDEYTSLFPSNIAPLTDDKPFFYQYEKPENILKYRNSVIYNLFKTVVLIFIFSIVLILLPAYLARRHKTKKGKGINFIIYFFSVGMGFMLIEIGLIQKSSLFLGHPTYSFITVVFSILLFSGLGSLFSSSMNGNNLRLIYVSMVVIIILSLIYLLYIDEIYNILLPQDTSLRMLLMGLLLSPLGFVMGIPFPKGIQLLSRKDEGFIPVAMGVNGVGSVFGASSAVPLAMLFGFSIIFLLAVSIYLIGLISLAVKR